MRFKRVHAVIAATLVLAGCSVSMQAPTPTGGGGGTLVEAPLAPEAEAQFKMLDVDPDEAALTRLAQELNITVVVNNEVTVVNGVERPKVVLPTNAESVCRVSQREENHQPTCANWTVSASSERNDYFTVGNVHDTNLRSAWAPLENDANPALTFTLDSAMDLSAMTLKMSPQGVVVDVDVMVDGQWTRLVTGLVPEYRTLDWINLPQTRAEQVRLSFRGPQASQVLVCHVGLFGPGCGASAAPSAPVSTAPTAAPTASPSAAPSTDASASPEPTASPSVEVSASPSAMPTESPSASPSAEPTTEVSASPSAEPTESPSAEPTASPTTTP